MMAWVKGYGLEVAEGTVTERTVDCREKEVCCKGLECQALSSIYICTHYIFPTFFLAFY